MIFGLIRAISRRTIAASAVFVRPLRCFSSPNRLETLHRAAGGLELSWHDADHRLVEKFAEDMTMQDFMDAAEDQRDRTLREHARRMAAFMNHDGAGEQTTLGEILDRDQVWRA